MATTPGPPGASSRSRWRPCPDNAYQSSQLPAGSCFLPGFAGFCRFFPQIPTGKFGSSVAPLNPRGRFKTPSVLGVVLPL